MKESAAETLTLNKEFKHAYFQGKFKTHPLLVTYRIPNRKKTVRYGITTSKKIGCAVKRNRSRRVIRQAFCELLKEGAVLAGYDYVFVARPKTPLSYVPEVKQVMKWQLASLNHVKKSSN